MNKEAIDFIKKVKMAKLLDFLVLCLIGFGLGVNVYGCLQSPSIITFGCTGVVSTVFIVWINEMKNAWW